MNHIYRLVWNDRTQSLIAVAETTRGRGKSKSGAGGATAVVVGALLAMNGSQAIAANVCNSTGPNVFNTGQTLNYYCLIGSGGSLTLTPNGQFQASVSLNPNYLVYVTASNPSGFITNAGTISDSVSKAVRISADFGVVENSGLISAYNTGVNVYSGTTSAIINGQNGTISATTGIYVDTLLQNGVFNEGNILARNGGGIASTSGSIAGGVTNTGTISTWSSGAIIGYGAQFSGGITNTGLLLSGSNSTRSGWAGVMVYGGGSLTGDIINTINGTQVGSIVGGTAGGIQLGFNTGGGWLGGNIVNSGIIESTASGGVVIHGSGTVVSTISGRILNQASGTISGPGASSAGVDVIRSFVGNGIENNGLIVGAANYGVRFDQSSVLVGGIVNSSSGTISGGNAGLLLKTGSYSGGIINDGLITTAGTLSGLFLSNASLTNGITNSGIIDAPNTTAVTFVGTLGGGLVNLAGGTISGGIGIYFGASNNADGITNSGLIAGGQSFKLRNSINPFTIHNIGTMSGAADISINNLSLEGTGARVIGDTVATTGDVTVNGTFTSEGTFGVDQFVVANGGTFTQAHAITANSGVNVASGGRLDVVGTALGNITGDYTQAGTLAFWADGQYPGPGQDHGGLSVSGNVTVGGTIDADITANYCNTLQAGDTITGVIYTPGGSSSYTVVGPITVNDNCARAVFAAAVNYNYLDLVVQSVIAPPSAPTSVSGTAGPSSAIISFSPPSSTGGGSITGYAASCTSTNGGAAGSVTGSSSPLTVNGLTAGKTYTCDVTASNGAGAGSAATTSPIIPLGVPDAPTAVSATAGNGQAVVSFTAPTNTGGSTITGYAASCTSSDGGAAGTVSGSASPLTVTGLTNGKTYTCAVTATNAQGTGSASTASSPIIPLGVPDAPTAVSATAGNGQAVVSFTAPTNTGGSTITGYAASCTSSDGGAAGTVSGSASPLTVTGLTNGKTYTCAVTATNAQGTGSASTASSPIIPLGVPDAPTSVSATAGNAQVSLSWTAPTNTGGQPITGYTVTGAPGGGCITTGATNCVITGLTNGTAYTFQVVATTSQGDSAAASSNTVTPEAATAPVIFAVSPSTGPQAGGTAVIITGTNLTGASQVLFGGTPATGVSVNQSGNQINAISPAHAGGAVDVTVVTPAGEDVLEMSFTYDAPPAVPGTPIPAPGDRQVNVSWPQVLTGGDPVSYTVTASPGGQTCTVPFPGQAYPYASCIVTGLTNGTAYTFRVQATNALGNATSGSSIAATPAAVLNGACGAANGVSTLVPPAGLLCGTGTASAVTNTNGTFTWDCTGTNGGSTAQCSAPGAPSEGSQTGSTAFTTDTASNGCNLQSARLLTPPDGGPGGTTTMPYGVVNFEMVSCTGNEARVRMTYAGIVEGMQFWKYVVNTYHNGWVQLPSNQVTLSGNTAEFTIVDNGEWDNDPTDGAIADPGGPGYDPNALTPPGQPTNVTGTAGNQSATIRWDVPASGGQPVRYTVAALINGVPTGQTCEAIWPATSCTVQGLTNGQAYGFTVTAANGAGVGQAGVIVAPVTPRPNPVPPPNPIPTLGPVGLAGLGSLLAGIGGWRQRRRAQAERKAD